MSPTLIIALAFLAVSIIAFTRGSNIELVEQRVLKDHNELIATHHVASDAIVDLLAYARRLGLVGTAYAQLSLWSFIGFLIALGIRIFA